MSGVEGPLSLATDRCAHRDHGCASRVNGLDDFCVVDALEVDGRDSEVAVAELALNDDEGTPSWAISTASRSLTYPQLLPTEQ